MMIGHSVLPGNQSCGHPDFFSDYVRCPTPKWITVPWSSMWQEICCHCQLLTVHYFKNLIEKLDPQFQIPSRKHLSTKLIDEKAAEVKDNLIKQLNKAPSVCLTIDLWSNRQMKGFMGITGHFIKDSTMKSVMTACKQFKGKHSFDNILHEYEETMASFDICGKVTSVISDNASNMVKAFWLFHPWIQYR